MSIDNPFTQQDYKIIERKVLYQGVFTLVRLTLQHRLFDGTWSEQIQRELLERRSAAAILPYDPVLDRVILIEQFRPGSFADPQSPWLIEIPAGVLGKNEQPNEVAHREAIEEANCHISHLTPICEYFVSPGGTDEYLNLYCGKVDSRDIKGVHGLKNEHEDIRVINIPTDEAIAKFYAGQIKTSPAIIALLWLQSHRKQLQEEWQSGNR